MLPRPEKYTIKPERKEIAAVSIDLTRHDDFQGPRKLEVCGHGGRPVLCIGPLYSTVATSDLNEKGLAVPDFYAFRRFF